MGYEDRRGKIAQLEEIRGSRVLSYVLSDRETFPIGVPGFSTNMAGEPQLLIADLLRQIGKVPRLDVFLFTRGGATESVWPSINLLRQHCDQLAVMVPFRAHSAGTMLCLGADSIVMSDMAELSPIDPTTGNQFNPRDPANPATQYGISVEDVTAYFEMAQELAGLQAEEHILEIMKQLTANVHPLALGNVQRVVLMIRRLARELLALHLALDEDAAEKIVTGLTTRFYSHLHAISRREAQALLGDWVVAPTDAEANVMRDLFETYASTLQLRDRFSLPQFMADQPVRDLHVVGGLLETTDASDIYTTDIRVSQRPNLPPGVQVQVPPGQPLPLVPWVGRTYDYGIQRMGWVSNGSGE